MNCLFKITPASLKSNKLTDGLTLLISKYRYLSAKFDSNPFDLHNLENSPSTQVELTREDALLYFKQMNLIRKMEAEAAILYQHKLIVGFCHLYSGQEACAVGIKAIMRPQDTSITSYRCHGWALLMGEPIYKIMTELTGKESGSSRGKGGSMHLYTKNFFGGNGIVGSHISMGTGIALAHKYKENGAISFTSLGEGAMNQGQTHESFNMAKLFNLPVVYVIENNRYGMGTSSKRSSANVNCYTRGDLIPGIRLDGMDILSVREAGKFAVDHVTSGKGPILLELTTYRYFGHSMSDPGTSYRTRDEIKDVREQHDCIKMLTEKIISSELATEEELKAIEKENKDIVHEASEKAKKDKVPDLKELTCDIYQDYKGEVRLPSMLKTWSHKNIGVSVARN